MAFFRNLVFEPEYCRYITRILLLKGALLDMKCFEESKLSMEMSKVILSLQWVRNGIGYECSKNKLQFIIFDGFHHNFKGIFRK